MHGDGHETDSNLSVGFLKHNGQLPSVTDRKRTGSCRFHVEQKKKGTVSVCGRKRTGFYLFSVRFVFVFCPIRNRHDPVRGGDKSNRILSVLFQKRYEQNSVRFVFAFCLSPFISPGLCSVQCRRVSSSHPGLWTKTIDRTRLGKIKKWH